MRLQKIKVLTGTSLSLLFSLLAVYPAIADHSPEHGRGQQMAQMDDNSIRGRIRNIVGNVVTLELPDGSTRSVMIGRADRDRLGLRPGMEIATSMRDGSMTVEVVSTGPSGSTSEDNAPLAETTSTTEEAPNGTTRGRVVQETTIRRTTTTAPVVQQTTEQTVGDVQESVQQVDQNTDMTNTTQETTQPARPVRALW